VFEGSRSGSYRRNAKRVARQKEDVYGLWRNRIKKDIGWNSAGRQLLHTAHVQQQAHRGAAIWQRNTS
jgi:hypothetical protein